MRKAFFILLSLVFACLPVVAQTTIQKVPGPAPAPKRGEVLSTTVRLPDFVISSYRFEQTGQNVIAYAKLLNSGLFAGSFQAGQTMAILSVRGSSYKYNAPGGGSYVAPGNTVDIRASLGTVPEGTYPATWTANPNRVIGEKNFTNNVLECQLIMSLAPPPPSVPLPDLIISQLTVQTDVWDTQHDF
jgi:hypothetical protein